MGSLERTLDFHTHPGSYLHLSPSLSGETVADSYSIHLILEASRRAWGTAKPLGSRDPGLPSPPWDMTCVVFPVVEDGGGSGVCQGPCSSVHTPSLHPPSLGPQPTSAELGGSALEAPLPSPILRS